MDDLIVGQLSHLESCQFAMATDVHRCFRCMGDWSHSAGLTIRQINLSHSLRLRGSDVVFAAGPFVDEVCGCARVDYRIDSDLFFYMAY